VSVLFWLLACGPKLGPAVDDVGLDPTSMAAARPAGFVHDGWFADETHGFEVPVLEGWVAEPGPSTGLMRLAMLHVPTDTRIEFWTFEGTDLQPRVREGCTWSFMTEGRPRGVASDVLVATCVPDDPEGRRVFGTMFCDEARTMQIEIHPPNDALVEGKEAAEVVIRQLRW
jgi:hypothetical protein